MTNNDIKMRARNVQVFYGENHAIKEVDVDIEDKTVTAFIGPSGCRQVHLPDAASNRMNDTIDVCRVEGDIHLEGETSTIPRSTLCNCAPRSAWCSRNPTPFPSPSTERRLWAPKTHGLSRKQGPKLDEIVEKTLRRAGIW